jgi:hypothetical protein
MDLLQTILSAQGGGAVNELAKNFGLSQGQATSAVESLLPSLAAGFAKNAATPSGLEGLMGALTGGQHAGYLEDLSRLGAPATAQDGNSILGHVLGSKDVSRQVAAQAAAQTGIGADVLKKMLPVLASLAMGAMAKQMSGGGARRVPGAASAGPSAAGGLLGSLLDQNKDGSIADDVLGMLGKFMR